MKADLVETEWGALPVSVEFMPFIIGLRFLTDYLCDDVYYKVTHEDQNLDRCRNQFRLLDKMKAGREEIKQHVFSFK